MKEDETQSDVDQEVVEAPQPEQEYKEFDPKAIERELLEQAQSRAEDPMETAAGAYQMYVPHFKRLLPKMSTRGLRRVLNYMVLYPLEQDSVKSASELEKQFMQLVNSLVEAKFVMVMASYQQNAQQLYDAQNAALTAEETNEVINELKEAGITDEEIDKLKEQNKG